MQRRAVPEAALLCYNRDSIVSIRSILLCLAVATPTASCGLFGPPPSLDTARIRVDGPSGATVRVVTSTRFLRTQNELGQVSYHLVVADTLTLPLPSDEEFDISETQRFLVEVLTADTAGTIELKVWLDDEERYDQSADYPEQGGLKFIFIFNEPAGSLPVI